MDIQEKMVSIQSLIQATNDELYRLGEQHSCIYAGAVLSKTLKAIGFTEAYPLTVKPRILNPAFVQRIKTQLPPSDEETLAKWAEEGCSIVAIGGGETVSTDKQWAGHLIVVLPNFYDDRHAFCDLTITQASVPEWGINLMPVFVRVPNTFVTGETEFKAPVNGSLIIYEAFPNDKSFEAAPVWKNMAYQDLAVKNIIG